MSPVRKRLLTTIAALLMIAALTAIGIYVTLSRSTGRRNPAAPGSRPEAPADLARVRPSFTEGLDAIQRGEGSTAVKHLSSFSFGSRAVEEYRLYYLATAFHMTGALNDARTTLATLWNRGPRFAYRQDAGFTLGNLYAERGDWYNAAEVYGAVAAHSEQPDVAGTARSEYLRARFHSGDIGSVLFASHNVITASPAAAFAAPSAKLLRDLLQIPETAALPLTIEERIDRCGELLATGHPDVALAEANGIDRTEVPSGRRDELTWDRGTALQRLRRYEESNGELETLASSQYRYAIPALFAAAQNYRALSASINPLSYKTVIQKVQTGKRKVKGKVRPVFRNVKKSVMLIDLNLKAKKEAYAHLGSERLKDVLQLPADAGMRMTVLTQLLDAAVAGNQSDYMRQLTVEIVKIEPYNDQALQWFWDRAWAAWQKGDLTGARDAFSFIATTFRNPNVRRQSNYWLARTLERSGQKASATSMYQELASAPFEDLYAKFAVIRGATPLSRSTRPLADRPDDWQSIADRQIPRELELAYELTALGDSRDARAEVQSNTGPSNHTWADAILGELYYTQGSTVVALRLLKRAFPQLASVEQDQVPIHFVKMYYPLRYEQAIRKYSTKWKVDPYLLMALIHQESAFDPVARSGPGARGLMQIMPATGREIGRHLHGGFFNDGKLDDPDTNIELGAYYVQQLLTMFGGNSELATAAYNAGLGNVRNWRSRTHAPLDEVLEGMPFSETRNYVKRVTILRSSYRQYDPR